MKQKEKSPLDQIAEWTNLKPDKEIKQPESKPAEKPPEVKIEKKPEDRPKIQKVGGRRWWLVGVGALVGVGGLGGFIAFSSNQNMLIGMVSVFTMIGAGFLVYYGLKNREEGIIISRSGKKQKAQLIVNSLNIYSDKIEFVDLPQETLDKMDVQPRKCRNDNKYYFVNIWGTAWGGKEDKVMPFRLPDTQYRDPREFANNLNIPAHRRLAQRKATLMEKVSPWILVAAIVISGIIWIATMPSPGGN